MDESNEEPDWLCTHYKRRCLIQFECCDEFWPCHRCHNNRSICGKTDSRSRDTKKIICVRCNKEQPFGLVCGGCLTVFAEYFCGICKHLTGTDDHPYHCLKCGICRIHGDRSFHCDVCRVCFPTLFHKCREASTQDECCISLEVVRVSLSRYHNNGKLK